MKREIFLGHCNNCSECQLLEQRVIQSSRCYGNIVYPSVQDVLTDGISVKNSNSDLFRKPSSHILYSISPIVMLQNSTENIVFTDRQNKIFFWIFLTNEKCIMLRIQVQLLRQESTCGFLPFHIHSSEGCESITEVITEQ